MTLRQREPSDKCPAFLAFVRTKRCCACFAPAPSQAAHIKMGRPDLGERYFGTGERPHDRRAVPLCVDCHLDGPEAQHKIGEREFWRAAGIDPFKVAAELWREFQMTFEPKPTKRKPMMGPGLECEFVIEGGVMRRPSPELDPELYQRRKPR